MAEVPEYRVSNKERGGHPSFAIFHIWIFATNAICNVRLPSPCAVLTSVPVHHNLASPVLPHQQPAWSPATAKQIRTNYFGVSLTDTSATICSNLILKSRRSAFNGSHSNVDVSISGVRWSSASRPNNSCTLYKFTSEYDKVWPS